MRKRLREWGQKNGRLTPGPLNSITDVPGVKVGHVTLHYDLENGAAVRTGVTALLPHSANIFKEKVPAASYVINGFGKTTGLVQVDELGAIESPIMLTNTFSVPAVTEGALAYLLEQNPEIGDTTGTVNVVVGECNDSFLNDIRGFHVRPEHAVQAIKQATGGIVPEGAIGAGTGMSCFQFKGGIGTSSRKERIHGKAYTVGALILSNFGRKEDLRFLGIPFATLEQNVPSKVETPDGSIMMILATDAPLSSRQLKRLAKRAAFGLAWTGSYASHGSGDIVIAFSNHYTIPHSSKENQINIPAIREDGEGINLLFQMAAESVEEAILNSLLMAATTIGRNGRVVEEFPDRFMEHLLKIKTE